MWTFIVAKNKKKFGHVTHVVHGLKFRNVLKFRNELNISKNLSGFK